MYFIHSHLPKLLLVTCWAALLPGLGLAQTTGSAPQPSSVLTPEEWGGVRQKLQIRAAKSGVDQTADFQKALQGLKSNLLTDFYIRDYLKKHPVSEAEITALYEAKKPTWMVQEYRASHILAQTPEKLKTVQERLAAGQPFEKVAYDESDDPMSGGNGGQLGWFSDIPQAPELMPAIKGLALNQVSEPVKSAAGMHILKLFEVRDAAIPSLDEVREELHKDLAMQKLKKLVAGDAMPPSIKRKAAPQS